MGSCGQAVDIVGISIIVRKDLNATQWMICQPLKNFGTDCYTEEFSLNTVELGYVGHTVTPHGTVTDSNPASWIVHTLDDGKSWDIDSSSLFNDDFYDGRDIAFSDQTHGWIFAQRLSRHFVAIFKYYPPIKDAVRPDIYIFRSSKPEVPYQVYPNPVSNETSIQFTNEVPILNIDFFDVLGRKWVCPYEISAETLAHIHTEGLRTGCYFAHVIQQNGNYTVPFIEQH